MNAPIDVAERIDGRSCAEPESVLAFEELLGRPKDRAPIAPPRDYLGSVGGVPAGLHGGPVPSPAVDTPAAAC